MLVIALLNRLAGFLDTKILLRIYKRTILPVIEYGCIVWHERNKSLSDKLKRLQNQAMRVILGANRTTCTHYMRNTLGLLTLYSERRFLRFVFIFKILNNQNCPKQLEGYLTSKAELQNRNLRNQGTLNVPQSRTSSGGGRKGGTNTAIPHQNLAKYRNRSYKWEKVDVVNTTNPPFK